MSLHQKVTVALLSGAVGLLGLMYGLASVTLHRGYLQLEEEEVSRNVGRAQEAYEGYLKQLNAVNYQWSVWDDSYEFIQNPRPDYVENNLYYDVFLTSGFDLIAFFNSNNQLVYGDFYDPVTGERHPFLEEIFDYLRSNNLFDKSSDPKAPVSGFIKVNKDIVIISLSPIVRSNESDPIQGELLTGRVLSQHITDDISNKTRQTVIFHPLSSQLIFQRNDVLDMLLAGQSTVVWLKNENTIHGYSILSDLSGNPGLLLQTIQDRSIYQQFINKA
ncbi:hypothetical protein L1047_04280 [Synechococcus sp. Nb3U1]|uniref:CHASE4 domain-containing protein n=1 Tax=Synechococcus sp. Nb3U1 TaxID=1914529 RepID=UPI001F18C330|nr:CHASE4 domain-containing protein [Synechococcus sp. Nb3U1]MCF2970413.1 hypothetical protein [Synechococcus sp. Nb3U1]